MKRILFLLLMLITISNVKCFAQDTPNIWTKIEIETCENLEKVLISGNKTLIFTSSNCYIGTNLANWRKINTVESCNICPVVFQGYIYINGEDGIYRSRDGEIWEKISSQFALSLAANDKKIFAFTRDPYHIAFESEDGINFKEIAGVQNLYPLPYRNANDFNPNFIFAESFGDTIYASGLTSMGSEVTCKSLDGGINWSREDKGERITDIELNGNELAMTVIDHSSYLFIVRGLYKDFKMGYGTFSTLKSFGDRNTIYCGGTTYSDGRIGGIIMEIFNIGNIFYTPDVINCLESNKNFIIAVGQEGAVYVKKNDFTDYLLSANSLTIIQSGEVGKEKIGIFPNPASNILNIIAIPGETIKMIDLNGKIVKSLIATGKKSLIDIGNLEGGVYIVKSGNKTTKFIKR